MTIEQKSELILRLLDSDLNEQGFELFQGLIKSDAEFLILYREHVMLEHALLSSHVNTVPKLSNPKVERRESRRNMRVAILGLAACLILALCAQFFIKSDDPGYRSASIEFAVNSKYEIEGKGNKNELVIGKTLRITQGAAKLELAKGVTAVVLAPAVFTIQDETTVILEQGKASFHVPEQAIGFTVVSKNGKVVDLGTQFTVVSGWSEMDEVYVEKGRVEVKNPSSNSQELSRREAVSIDPKGAIESIEYVDRQAHVTFPERVEIVFEDDFEDPVITDGVVHQNGVIGWQRVGKGSVAMGIYNPTESYAPSRFHKWYDRAELDDNSPTQGEAQSMSGRCLAFIIGSNLKSTGCQKKVGNIHKDSLYTFSITIGQRAEESPGISSNYELAFISEDKVIHSIKGMASGNAPNSFTSLSFSWDSSDLPEGVSVNDPLSVRVIAQGTANYAGESHLDFDNIRVTRSIQPVK